MPAFVVVITGTSPNHAVAESLARGLSDRLEVNGVSYQTHALWGGMDMRLGWLRNFRPGAPLGSTEPHLPGQSGPRPYLFPDSFLFAWWGEAPNQENLERMLDDGAASFIAAVRDGVQNVHAVPIYGG